MSKSYLSSLFKKQTGESISSCINICRVEQAKRMLLTTPLKIYEIAARCGFRDENYFIRVFKQLEDVTPLRFRERGRSR